MTSIHDERFSDRLLQRRIVLMIDEVNAWRTCTAVCSASVVFVGTPIDDGVANVVIAQLLHLASESPTKDIHLYINSPGGPFTAMMAIYDTMQFVAPDIATLCIGQAASSSTTLLAAGARRKRLVLGHARVLLQQPHIDGRQGALSDLAVEAIEPALDRTVGSLCGER
jgi:ATP-dependent Clp protease protease subunit